MAALKACGKMPPPPSSQTHPAKHALKLQLQLYCGAVGRMCAARHAEESAQLKFAGKCCLLRLQPNLLYCCSHTPSTLCRLLLLPTCRMTVSLTGQTRMPALPHAQEQLTSRLLATATAAAARSAWLRQVCDGTSKPQHVQSQLHGCLSHPTPNPCCCRCVCAPTAAHSTISRVSTAAQPYAQTSQPCTQAAATACLPR